MDDDGELEQLRARVAHLESLVERLAGTTDAGRRDAAAPRDSALDRRRMLRHGLGLGAAAVAGVGVLDAVGSSAAAADGDGVLVAHTVSPSSATSSPTRILNPSTSVHSPVLFQVDNATDDAVSIPSDLKAALVATFSGHDDNPTNQSAVLGLAEYGTGVEGRSDGFRGVSGVTLGGAGVHGEAALSGGIGVEAVADAGTAMSATATTGKALVASSVSNEAIHATTSDQQVAIVGDGGFGVVGNGTGDSGIGVGATGVTGALVAGSSVGADVTSQAGIAVKATSDTGVAIRAVSNGGVGATFQGATAAVRLVPTTTAGHPTSGAHQRGEIVLDHHGKLWVCTKSGTPGTWRQVAFV